MVLVVAALAAGVGLVLGIALARRPVALPDAPVPAERHPADSPPALGTALDALVTGVAVVEADETVVWANPAAARMGVLRGGRLVPAGLVQLARQARREARPVPGDVDVRHGRDTRTVRALALAATDGTHVALLLDDTTEARRVDAVRRDFVANVSHELKTPVGALSLLAEAIRDCGDDPEAIRRFADRMVVESARLSRLVQELIDLSRLQGAEPMRSAAAVPVRTFVDEAVDRTRLAAAARQIDVVVQVDHDLAVPGDDRQLATAVANLLDNAVAYSPERTRVGVSARREGGDVVIAVTDQGIGISAADCERIFERFYRVDPARSRETGGTGLGLAIVKHIATNHGGSVDVWSVEGTGSTFTLTLPAVPAPAMEGVTT